MKRFLPPCAALLALAVVAPQAAAAQQFESMGTRALGMAGAFVGVADDASAIYWNPGGLAAGSYFSLVFDRNSGKSLQDNDIRARSSSGTILALATPALGLGYYRLRGTSLAAVPTALPQQDRNLTAEGAVRVGTLITHQGGVTLVQSLTSAIAVGATLKFVRGLAASTVAPAGDRAATLDHASDPIGRASTRFDADIGVMAVLAGMRAGLTVRNVREPEFESAGGGPVRLQRQVRGGVSVHPLGVLLAADVDLTRNSSPLGDVRNVAAGAEARVVARAIVRAGLRVNTISDAVSGRSKVLALGGSFAVAGSAFIDAEVSTGSGVGSRGWGVAGRVGF